MKRKSTKIFEKIRTIFLYKKEDWRFWVLKVSGIIGLVLAIMALGWMIWKTLPFLMTVGLLAWLHWEEKGGMRQKIKVPDERVNIAVAELVYRCVRTGGDMFGFSIPRSVYEIIPPNGTAIETMPGGKFYRFILPCVEEIEDLSHVGEVLNILIQQNIQSGNFSPALLDVSCGKKPTIAITRVEYDLYCKNYIALWVQFQITEGGEKDIEF